MFNEIGLFERKTLLTLPLITETILEFHSGGVELQYGFSYRIAHLPSLIAPAPDYHPKKTAGKKNYSSGFLSTWPVSPSGIYGTVLLPFMLLTARGKKKTLFTDLLIYSRGITGFNDQRTSYSRGQGAILRSRDFNLRVKRA